LAEAHRLVKESGFVVVIEWDTAATPFGPPEASRISKETVLNIASQVGLREKKLFTPSPYHYGILLTSSVK
jgi:hypothetical protein